jgi:hypothetical protein
VLDRPDHIAASPADRARAALLDDPERSNREIALAVRSTPAIVGRCRRQLAGLGLLPASPYPRRSFPAHKALPRPPRILAEGACLGHDPDAWAEPGHPDRELARTICRTACHVRAACLEWSLSLPQDDLAIYAGLTAADRIRINRERAARPLPFSATTAGKNAARARRRAAAAQAEAS